MQSPSVLHEVLQAVAPHRYGLHCVVEGAGHEPPLQLAAAVAVPLLQDAPRHCEVGNAQAAVLLPSQLPPQALPSLVQEVRAPCGAPLTATHCPTLPATSHAWHCPLQAWLQQTPSAQEPFTHWFAAPQARPSAFFATHWPEPLQ